MKKIVFFSVFLFLATFCQAEIVRRDGQIYSLSPQGEVKAGQFIYQIIGQYPDTGLFLKFDSVQLDMVFTKKMETFVMDGALIRNGILVQKNLYLSNENDQPVFRRGNDSHPFVSGILWGVICALAASIGYSLRKKKIFWAAVFPGLILLAFAFFFSSHWELFFLPLSWSSSYLIYRKRDEHREKMSNIISFVSKFKNSEKLPDFFRKMENYYVKRFFRLSNLMYVSRNDMSVALKTLTDKYREADLITEAEYRYFQELQKIMPQAEKVLTSLEKHPAGTIKGKALWKYYQAVAETY